MELKWLILMLAKRGLCSKAEIKALSACERSFFVSLSDKRKEHRADMVEELTLALAIFSNLK